MVGVVLMSIASQEAGQASRFALGLVDMLDRVEYRRVSPEQQLDPIYRLRYEAYRREEFIQPNAQGIVRDEFDELPNAYAYGVYLDGQLVSSVRFHYMTQDFRTAPSHSVFTDVLDPLLDDGATFIDPGRFTADHEASLAFPALPFLTLRVVVMATVHWGVDYCLSSVRPEHVAFYRRVFNSKKLSAERYYHGLSFPMVLYASHVPSTIGGLCERYPFFKSTEMERQLMFGPKASTGMILPTARMAHMLSQRHQALAC
ncbi:Autoinducer synthase [Devosia enhydra]|uniref:Autoinducer synthase n=2 Tax=Devosia enhydra TaxID=665118 RepID=A0A1K2I3N5_9HYPH|nr:Autoinducer synthase [Devosia enhydra]